MGENNRNGNIPEQLDICLTKTVRAEEIYQNREIQVQIGQRSVRVTLPQPLRSGMVCRYSGLGRVGRDGRRGDLYLTVVVQQAVPVPLPVKPNPPEKKGSKTIAIVAALAAVLLICVGLAVGLPMLNSTGEMPAGHSHSWQNATCAAPRTCSECGETEGGTLGHDWQEATYASPKTCRSCGETEGTAKTLRAGDIVEFGEYEQDNIDGNGPETLRWIVLEVQGDRAMLIAEQCLEMLPYNRKPVQVQWQDCTLRQWLNDSFYTTAFNESQREAIPLTMVENHDNSLYGTAGGNTMDHVFLLSETEVLYYFSLPEIPKQSAATDRALFQGAGELGVSVYWWTRTPGVNLFTALVVDSKDSKLFTHGDSVNCTDNTVRPVIWVDYKASGFNE